MALKKEIKQETGRSVICAAEQEHGVQDCWGSAGCAEDAEDAGVPSCRGPLLRADPSTALSLPDAAGGWAGWAAGTALLTAPSTTSPRTDHQQRDGRAKESSKFCTSVQRLSKGMHVDWKFDFSSVSFHEFRSLLSPNLGLNRGALNNFSSGHLLVLVEHDRAVQMLRHSCLPFFFWSVM